MPRPTATNIRELILQVVQDQQSRPPAGTYSPWHDKTVLDEVAKRLKINQGDDLVLAVLTEWHDLFRTGYFAWGRHLNHPGPPFFHLTERSRRALERLSRDPANPAGYLRHISSVAKLNAVADSYLKEGLECFVNDLHKAAAVMIGCAAESLILELRDAVLQKLQTLKQPEPKNLGDWKVKTILDELQRFLDSKKGKFPRDLREEYEAYWSVFTQQIRAVRNEAGHPTSVDPVSPDGVHASFLVFPELARLSMRLNDWVTTGLT